MSTPHLIPWSTAVADLIVILTEQALGAGDAGRILALHEGEDLDYHVLVLHVYAGTTFLG